MNYPDLHALIICRSFLKDTVVSNLVSLLDKPGDPVRQSQLACSLVEKAERLGLQGNLLNSYLLYLLGEGKNPAAHSIAAHGRFDSGLRQALVHDMTLLWPYLHMLPSAITSFDFLDNYAPARSVSYEYLKELRKCLDQAAVPSEGAAALLDQYCHYGSGKLARYIAFRVDGTGSLIGIDKFPLLDFADLIGYEKQKEKLRINTENFISNRQANNVLLTGSRGTGKSTAVKALVNMYHLQGLRLIQINREQMDQLAAVMETLNRIQSKKFILFFDDLSFDEDDVEYKYLKSVIDGGVTPQPDNVLIYATSNRRHLLKETWQDRHDNLEEVYRHDSVNESISLSDRFGLILHYAEPTQEEYLQMIDHELQKEGIQLTAEELRIEGVRWEMEHSGRNGRIAQQFVKWYLGNHAPIHS
jgi:predicted AAA+ superfamily ATPase